MTDTKVKEDKSISVWDDFAELSKNPEFMREYEAAEEEFAKLRLQIRRRKARRAWRAALVVRVRESVQGLWHWLTRGVDRVAY